MTTTARRVQMTAPALLALLSVSHAAHAAPLDRSLVPADPAIVVHIDVEQATRSEFGRFVIERRAQVAPLAGLDGLRSFGLDPFKDFRGVTIVVPRGRPDGGVVIVRSTAAIDALWNHLKTEPHARAVTVGGQEIQSWDDNGKRKYGVVRPSKDGAERVVYVSDDWDSLAATLSVADGKAPSAGPGSGGAAAGAGGGGTSTPRAGSILFVDMREVPADMHKPGDLPAAALFGAMRGATLDVGDGPTGGGVSARLVMAYDSPQAAQDMRGVGEGLRAFARLASRNAPATSPLTGAAEAVQVQAAEDRLTVEGQWTGDQARAVLGVLLQPPAGDGRPGDAGRGAAPRPGAGGGSPEASAPGRPAKN